MFDFLRNLRKSDEEKRQETLTAYLDDALTPAEKQRFEQLLATDESLRASLEEQRLIRVSLHRLPRVRAPRNFTLDPAVYGRPVVSTADRLYPIMRAATAVVAILFVVVLVIDFGPFGGDQEAAAPLAERIQSAADTLEEQAEEAPMAEPAAEGEPIGLEAIEVTRLVEAEEAVAEEEAEMPAAEMPQAAQPAAEEPVEEAADEAAEAAVGEEAPPPSPEDASGGAPSAETPMAMLVSPTKVGQAATTEAGEGRAAGEPPQPLTGTAEAALPTTDSDAALTKEAASQPTPSPAASALAVEQQNGDDGQAGETAAARAGIGLSTTQILTIALGLALVVLGATTLLLRRRAR